MKNKNVGMMFYFIMCSWLDGDEPNYYTHNIFEKLYIRNQAYWYEPYLVTCLDY